MLQRSFAMAGILTMALSVSACGKKLVDSFTLEVGENSVTTEANFASDFSIDVTKSVDIDIKGKHYGTVGLVGANGDDPFKAFITADLAMFTSEVWDGFGPVNTLPNGDPLPAWINPRELVKVDIPDFTDQLSLTLYVGYKKPFYVGMAIGLKVLDNKYPEGLSLSQAFRKENKTWGQAVVYGPTYDNDGNSLTHGGLFFVAGFGGLPMELEIHKVHKGDLVLKRAGKKARQH